MKNIQLDMIVETKLSVNEFNKKFIEWVEYNNWHCGGLMFEVDEEGNKIFYKCHYNLECEHQYYNNFHNCNTCKIKNINCEYLTKEKGYKNII